MKTLPKGTTFDTTNFQLGELIHMVFDFFNVTPIHGFTYMLTVVCTKTRLLWELPNTSKQDPFHNIDFILITLRNEQHPLKLVRVDEDGDMEKRTDATKILVYDFNIYMETTGGDE